MNLSVRPALLGERGRLAQIVELQDNFLRCEKEIALEVIDDSFDTSQGYNLQVAACAGKIAGFMVFGPIPLTEKRYDLYWIAVDPRQGRRGIGSLLLLHMERIIADMGGGHIYVDTSSTQGYQRARSFYEKHDYLPAAHLEDFYRDGDDRIIYCKRC